MKIDIFISKHQNGDTPASCYHCFENKSMFGFRQTETGQLLKRHYSRQTTICLCICTQTRLTEEEEEEDKAHARPSQA